MKLSKAMQATLLERIEILSPEEVEVLKSIPPEVAMLLAHKIAPELDMLFLNLPSVKEAGGQMDPANVLDGEPAALMAQGGNPAMEQGALPPGPGPGGPPPGPPPGPMAGPPPPPGGALPQGM